MRWIDKYVGTVFCVIFSIFEWLHKLVARGHPDKYEKTTAQKRILIIKFLGFGSIILASDAFQAIRKKYPHASLSVLTLKQNRSIYEILDSFNEILDVEITSPLKFILQMTKTILYIRKNLFDIVIDFEFTARFSAIVSYLSRAKRRIGFVFKGVWRGGLFTDEVEFREDIKIRHSFSNLVKTITQVDSPSNLPHRLNIKESDQQFVNALLKDLGLLDKTPLIGMNINASELSLLRRWPEDYFVFLAEELIKKYSARIIFIGDKNDVQYVTGTLEKISNSARENIYNFAGRTSLPQLAYLMKKLNLFISNDSGPLHLAAYLGIPTVSFFGPETPLIYGPEDQSHIILYKNLDCSPCIRVKNYKHSKCLKDNRCLKEIKPTEVLSAIERKRIL